MNEWKCRLKHEEYTFSILEIAAAFISIFS